MVALKCFSKNDQNFSIQVQALFRADNVLEVIFFLRAPQESMNWLSFLQISKGQLGEQVLGLLKQKDELWKSHCFEFFFTFDPLKEPYFEVNFSPQGHWAFYSFEKYRQRGEDSVRPPQLKTKIVYIEKFGLDIHLELDVSLFLPSKQEIHMAPAAILKFPHGNEFWALEHSSQQPDFHNFKSKSMRLSKSQEA